MQTATLVPFKKRSDTALLDANLKLAIDRTTGTAERKRAAALADFPEFEAALVAASTESAVVSAELPPANEPADDTTGEDEPA